MAARVATAEAAIRAVERRRHALAEDHAEADLYAAARVMDFYSERIESRSRGLSGQSTRDTPAVADRIIQTKEFRKIYHYNNILPENFSKHVDKFTLPNTLNTK